MPAGYDSWTDEIERGEGYAIGGSVARQSVRTRPKWRAEVSHLARLAAVDLAIIVACALLVWLAAVLRSIPLAVIAAIDVTGTGLWFRHQRLERERRPR